jgi:hypothetical protein
LPEGFTVPAGETWQFDPNVSTTVTVTRNVVVEGTLQMRPAHPGVVHTLRFDGVDEDAFVGGHTMTPVASDVGLWITGAGQLDAVGTPRAGWNRTGDDPSWLPTDELVRAPHLPGDTTTFASHTKGAAPPVTVGPGGTVWSTEVANLTRNVRIEGTPDHRAHIMFVGCTQPQTLLHMAIRWVGPTKNTGETYYGGPGVTAYVDVNVVGRYGLHFHHCGDGVRGSTVEGVVIRDTGGPAFVPHLSNGITFTDCVAYNIRDAGWWWDDDTETHDVTFDRCAVMGVAAVPHFRGYATRGFQLGEGTGMTARNCVAVGVQGNQVNAGGFHWPATANQNRNVWVFHDNTAHNNRGPGISVWQNDANPHQLERFASYQNTTGISHGAYVNSYTYRDANVFANTTDVEQHAVGPGTFERVTLAGDLVIGKHSLASTAPTRYLNCLIGGQIKVTESGKAGVIRFESTSPATDLTPARFTVTSILSAITVHNSDGSTFTVVKP